MRVGIIGTGAVAAKHADAIRNLGWRVSVCTNRSSERGLAFADRYGAQFVSTCEELCRHPDVDLVDVCTLPDFRLEPVELCARSGKPVLLEKPIAIDLPAARHIIDVARAGGILLGVVSQHRFDDASLFLARALHTGRLGKLLQADCYVKWHRSPEYYARPIKGAVKGAWKSEGGGALITQAIHQVDLLRWLAGPVEEVSGVWQLGARHAIESEDVVSAVVRYASGATGVLQASTAFWPGYPERLELHGIKGSAILTGDRLTAWDVADDEGPPPPLSKHAASGASAPMALSLTPFERQFLDFGDAVSSGRQPTVSGEEGYQALEVVEAVYRSCRTGTKIILDAAPVVA